MKRIMLFAFLYLFPLLLIAQADSSAYEGKAGVADVAEEDPGLFLVMMLLLMGTVVAIGICFAIGLLLTGIIFVMVTAGIVSISAIMAWYRRSVYSGVKWLVYLSFVMVAIGGAIVAAFIARYYGELEMPAGELLLWSVPVGIAGGLIGGWTILKIGNFLYRRVLQ